MFAAFVTVVVVVGLLLSAAAINFTRKHNLT
jgi:hypothetical protein